ncbi:hypothetical protein LWI28_012962 [Acer negundo]|uniref:Uncharacterized protein n=1 Tax=Acer negundo TaxID=4023 RepID=A0AAD5I631_ACENE|nr:hypothetical protein LWI28_012962 [Acer negundo]
MGSKVLGDLVRRGVDGRRREDGKGSTSNTKLSFQNNIQSIDGVLKYDLKVADLISNDEGIIVVNEAGMTVTDQECRDRKIEIREGLRCQKINNGLGEEAHLKRKGIARVEVLLGKQISPTDGGVVDASQKKSKTQLEDEDTANQVAQLLSSSSANVVEKNELAGQRATDEHNVEEGGKFEASNGVGQKELHQIGRSLPACRDQ